MCVPTRNSSPFFIFMSIYVALQDYRWFFFRPCLLENHRVTRRMFCVSRANSEIAQVRAKSKQEQAAYQASLRKEQMKVDSLERTLEQKVGCRIFFKIYILKEIDTTYSV